MNENMQKIRSIECPVEKTVNIIGNKWSILIIREFISAEGPLRFNQILNRLKPISSRTLSRRLKILTEYNVIKKEIVSTTPLYAEYSLTERGLDLTHVLKTMAAWSTKWY